MIAVYQGDRVDRRLFVAGGFAEVNEKGCTVLAERADRSRTSRSTRRARICATPRRMSAARSPTTERDSADQAFRRSRGRRVEAAETAR